jgi:hypothetical protein
VFFIDKIVLGVIAVQIRSSVACLLPSTCQVEQYLLAKDSR